MTSSNLPATKPAGLPSEESRSWDRQEAVIEAYCKLGTLAKAAQAVGLTAEAAYWWQTNNTHDFNNRMARGRQGYRDYLENMVHERLSDPKGNRGSDVLLMGALNANHPDKWSRNIQVTHEVGREVMATLQKIQEQQSTALPIKENTSQPWLTGKPAVVEGESEVVEE